MKQKLNKKMYKHILLLGLIFFMFSILISTNIYAADESLTIKDVSIEEKSETVEIKEITFENSTINSYVACHKLNDFVKYKITIQNNDDVDYYISNITDNSQNDFFTYSYSEVNDMKIEAKGTAIFYLTTTYNNENIDVSKRTQSMNVEIKLNLKDNTGNEIEKTISFNPKTGDNIIIYFAILIISVIALIILFKKTLKKNKKIKLFTIIALTILITPTIARAANGMVTLNFKNTFVLEDKMVIKYVIDGKEKTIVVGYDEKIVLPDEAEFQKDGYNFLGFYKEDGTPIDENTRITRDLKIVPKYEPIQYTYTLDLGYGNQVVEKYTIESEEITLPNPTKTDFEFLGWTGGDITTPTKDLTIPAGSIGNIKYKANWNYLIPDDPDINQDMNYIPLSLSGFNKDVVIDSTSEYGKTDKLDGTSSSTSFTFLSSTYRDPQNSSVNTKIANGDGVFKGGQVIKTTTGQQFKLQLSTSKNAIQVNKSSKTAKLYVNKPVSYDKIALLTTGGGGNTNIKVKVQYTDGTYSAEKTVTAYDWYSGPNDKKVVKTLGRVKTVNDGGIWYQGRVDVNDSGNINYAGLYEYTINGLDKNKKIETIEFTYSSGSIANIFAVSGIK